MEDAHEASLSELRARSRDGARGDQESQRGGVRRAQVFARRSAIEALERHFEEAHGAYLGSTDNRTESFKRLTKSDATSAKTIEKRMRRLLRLKEQIETQKRRETASRAEWAERNRGVRAEKERVRAHYEKLDKEMRRDREREKRRLLKLVEESGEARKALEAKTATAERALRLARMVRALETEAEKIAPFASGVHPVAGGSDATHADSDQSAATEEERAIASAMARVEAAEGRRALLEGAAAEAAAEAAAANETSRGARRRRRRRRRSPAGSSRTAPGLCRVGAATRRARSFPSTRTSTVSSGGSTRRISTSGRRSGRRGGWSARTPISGLCSSATSTARTSTRGDRRPEQPSVRGERPRAEDTGGEEEGGGEERGRGGGGGGSERAAGDGVRASQLMGHHRRCF